MRTRTEGAIRWLVVALGLGLAANAVLLANLLRLYVLGDLGIELTLTLDAVWEVLLFASVVPGFIGFWRVRQGTLEFGPDHASDVRRGASSFLVGAAAAVAFLATGLVLGFVYVPMSTPGGAAIRAVHEFAPLFITAFVGLFLLWTLWRLGGSVVRTVSLASLIVGLIPVMTGLVGRSVPMSEGLFVAVGFLPVLSMAGWLAACLLVAGRLKGTAPGPVAGPSTA